MSKTTLYKAGSIAFILLGILHLLAALTGVPNDPQAVQLMTAMQNYKINLFGQHDLFTFHTGFSLMMGFLLSAFGMQNLVLAEAIAKNLKAQWTTLMITMIALVISLIYFHLLADAFIFFSLVCYMLPLRKGSKK